MNNFYEWKHLVHIDEKRKHVALDCPCNPVLDHKNKVFIHNSLEVLAWKGVFELEEWINKKEDQS